MILHAKANLVLTVKCGRHGDEALHSCYHVGRSIVGNGFLAYLFFFTFYHGIEVVQNTQKIHIILSVSTSVKSSIVHMRCPGTNDVQENIQTMLFVNQAVQHKLQQSHMYGKMTLTHLDSTCP